MEQVERVTDPVQPGEGDPAGDTPRRGATYRGAIAVFAVFSAVALATLYAAWSAGVDDTRWSRILVIFSSLEALGFAAAGVLIGSSIESPTRRVLEDRARDAEDRLRTGAEAIEDIERSLAPDEGGRESARAEIPGAAAERLATVRRMMVRGR